MKTPQSRRTFLTEVGRGMMVASVGTEVASQLGLGGTVLAGEAPRLDFGAREALVSLMQETPPDRLLPLLAERLKAGCSLRELVAAGALANARSFGGEDYVGFHTMMALAPSLTMAQELPSAQQALPVFKVLYRNTNRIQESGGRAKEVLQPLPPTAATGESPSMDGLKRAVHEKDVTRAEAQLASLIGGSLEQAFESLISVVGESPEVHRVVMPYRAWDLLGVVGQEQATTLLRQSVRYCIKNEDWSAAQASKSPRLLLPKLLEEHHLLDRAKGDRVPDEVWTNSFLALLFSSTPEQAAAAAAGALAEGIAPDSVSEAVSLAANQLVLRDHGRTPNAEVPGKPLGSVHGDSIGVHASDSANAWRNMARVGGARHAFACGILGAWQVARDRIERGGDFAHWEPLPLAHHLEAVRPAAAGPLLEQLEEAVRGNLQARAAAVIASYGAQGHDPRGAYGLLLRYAISEDGALHGEKYYRTVSEEFAATRPSFRWRHLIGLARVTASEYGRPAPGMAQARDVLGV